jgi:hypothetical protein
MQARQHVHEFRQLVEVLDCAVTAPALEIAHERRAVDWREHLRSAADVYAALGVTRVLGEFGGRSLAPFPCDTLVEAHARALDVGARFAPNFERLRVIAELEADFLDDPVGLLFELDQAFFAEELVERDLALDVRGCGGLRARAFAAGAAATATSCAAYASGFCWFAHVTPRCLFVIPDRMRPT